MGKCQSDCLTRNKSCEQEEENPEEEKNVVYIRFELGTGERRNGNSKRDYTPGRPHR